MLHMYMTILLTCSSTPVSSAMTQGPKSSCGGENTKSVVVTCARTVNPTGSF